MKTRNDDQEHITIGTPVAGEDFSEVSWGSSFIGIHIPANLNNSDIAANYQSLKPFLNPILSFPGFSLDNDGLHIPLSVCDSNENIKNNINIITQVNRALEKVKFPKPQSTPMNAKRIIGSDYLYIPDNDKALIPLREFVLDNPGRKTHFIATLGISADETKNNLGALIDQYENILLDQRLVITSDVLKQNSLFALSDRDWVEITLADAMEFGLVSEQVKLKYKKKIEELADYANLLGNTYDKNGCAKQNVKNELLVLLKKSAVTTPLIPMFQKICEIAEPSSAEKESTLESFYTKKQSTAVTSKKRSWFTLSVGKSSAPVISGYKPTVTDIQILSDSYPESFHHEAEKLLRGDATKASDAFFNNLRDYCLSNLHNESREVEQDETKEFFTEAHDKIAKVISQARQNYLAQYCRKYKSTYLHALQNGNIKQVRQQSQNEFSPATGLRIKRRCKKAIISILVNDLVENDKIAMYRNKLEKIVINIGNFITGFGEAVTGLRLFNFSSKPVQQAESILKHTVKIALN